MTVTQVNDYNEYNNKIKTMTLSAGNVTRMVASYSYDDIGRLVSLKRSGNVGMVNYAYNIRNWLNETKSDEMHRTNPHNVIKINNINEFIFNMQKQLSK